MARPRSRPVPSRIPPRKEDLAEVPPQYSLESVLEQDGKRDIILDLCGGTGDWSKPYRRAGYCVTVVDPLRDTGDVRELKYLEGVRGVLAAPPCNVFSRASVVAWKRMGQGRILEALSVVDACLRVVIAVKPLWWALENPPGRLKHYLGPPVMMFDPCEFGDPWTKQTYLWGRFRRPERGPRVEPVCSMMQKEWRSSERARTPPGFARAFFKANP